MMDLGYELPPFNQCTLDARGTNILINHILKGDTQANGKTFIREILCFKEHFYDLFTFLTFILACQRTQLFNCFAIHL